jgi:methylmalonyl-CoA mutase, C-terminal domain
LGRLGEGYKESSLKFARSLADAGCEVVYTELQDPEAIVRSAVQESFDVIGMTTLPGADMEVFQRISDVLNKEGRDDILVTAGGIMDEADVARLKARGVKKFFPRGTSVEAILEWGERHIPPRKL